MPDDPDDFVTWAHAVELLSERGAFSPAAAAGHILQAVKTDGVRLRDLRGDVLRWQQTPEAEKERDAARTEAVREEARRRDEQETERATDALRKMRREEAKNAPRYNPLSRWRRD